MSDQDNWAKLSLRLKLRQTSGVPFQDFFSNVMGRLHLDDFVRVRPFGKLGDKGCDGYLASTGCVYACYGALNGDNNKVANLISKMKDDFAKAEAHLPSIMKEWCFVHNLVDGLPIEAVTALEELKKKSPNIKFGFFGMESFEAVFDDLNDQDQLELVGPVATNKDAQDLQASELREVIAALASVASGTAIEPGPISPVPQTKLDDNKLPHYWHTLLRQGFRNAHIVADYLSNHHDPVIGDKVARIFSDRYKYLRSQTLKSGVIMDKLYEYATGAGEVTPARQVAAVAVLAHLFESCDIGENVLEIVAE